MEKIRAFLAFWKRQRAELIDEFNGDRAGWYFGIFHPYISLVLLFIAYLCSNSYVKLGFFSMSVLIMMTINPDFWTTRCKRKNKHF
jgi:hypothetical protein